MQASVMQDSTFLPWLTGYGAAFGTLPLSLQYLFAALFGLAIGSFLTVVIHRVPIMMERAWQEEIDAEREAQADSGMTPAAPQHAAAVEHSAPYNLCHPRSACPGCGHVLGIRENIPLFSYLLSRGRCRACATPIGRLYPMVEALTMVCALAILWRFGPGWTSVAAFGLCASLIALAFIDARTHLLPDSITLPLLWAGLLLNLGNTFVPLADAVAGAAAGYLFLWLIYWGFRLLRGKEGMGYGDFKLLAALGAWLGWHALPQIVVISAVAGSVLGVAALIRGKLHRDQPLPFGPYLAIAGVVSLFCGEPLLHWIGQ
jgi:leader peptidase (prepilin peptidase)/N-methyltransferase